MKISIKELADRVVENYQQQLSSSAFTVGISGIDASGKGYITKLLQEELEQRGYKVANINIDPWQNPIPVRLQQGNAAANFYKNVFRWDDVFNELLKPLKQERSIFLKTQLIRTDADIYYTHIYRYEGIDILLIEAILLFQDRFLPFYDYKIWIDCSFETGMRRALARNVEKLEQKRLEDDYNVYYYAAQRLHFEKDNPVSHADLIIDHDSDLY